MSYTIPRMDVQTSAIWRSVANTVPQTDQNAVATDRRLHLRRGHVVVGIDRQPVVYNLFNDNTGTAFNQAFGTDGLTWLRQTAVMGPRFVRFNVTMDF